VLGQSGTDRGYWEELGQSRQSWPVRYLAGGAGELGELASSVQTVTGCTAEGWFADAGSLQPIAQALPFV
jgi:hypothetical protein